jgi:hypothetical protein
MKLWWLNRIRELISMMQVKNFESDHDGLRYFGYLLKAICSYEIRCGYDLRSHCRRRHQFMSPNEFGVSIDRIHAAARLETTVSLQMSVGRKSPISNI